MGDEIFFGFFFTKEGGLYCCGSGCVHKENRRFAKGGVENRGGEGLEQDITRNEEKK